MWNVDDADESRAIEDYFESGTKMMNGEVRVGCWVDAWMVSIERGLAG